MENILTEFKVIETDDGYRIEIKGNKDQLKSFMKGCGEHQSMRHHHRHGFGRGSYGFDMHPPMWMKLFSHWGPWSYESDFEEEQESPKT